MSRPRPLVLLTALGTVARDATYRIEGRESTRPLAPLALVDLAGERPDRVLAVCTEEALATTFPILRAELEDLGVDIQAIGVPGALDAGELDEFVGAVSRAVSDEAPLRLWVDLTHGFRHHAVLLYAACLYLASLEQLALEHVWYAPLSDAGADVLDLVPLVRLPELVQAVREVAETGSARSLAQFVGGDADTRRRLDDLTRALLAGLPLEAGAAIAALLDAGAPASDPPRREARALRRALRRQQVPLAEVLAGRLVDVLAPLRCEPKGQVRLDESELRRQGALVERLLDWRSVHTAAGLMREWLVSWAIWADAPEGADTDWLDPGVRRRAEARLGALRQIESDKALVEQLSEQQRRVGTLWDRLGRVRNAYMHFGMQRQHVDPERSSDGSDLHTVWPEARSAWEQLATELPRISLATSGSAGALLVSPVGLSPGVLTNAIRKACEIAGGPPAHLVVLCSPESRPLISEATARAGFRGEPHPVQFEDPHTALAALRRSAYRHLPNHPELRALLVQASEVLVNLTGGTTAMSLAAQQLADAALAYERPVCRFALIDRRSAEEQQRDPWADCEVVRFDDRVTPRPVPDAR